MLSLLGSIAESLAVAAHAERARHRVSERRCREAGGEADAELVSRRGARVEAERGGVGEGVGEHAERDEEREAERLGDEQALLVRRRGASSGARPVSAAAAFFSGPCATPAATDAITGESSATSRPKAQASSAARRAPCASWLSVP